MGRMKRGSEHARGFGVRRLLLGAALGVFGPLLLGAMGMATTAWASDESAETTGLAAVTDPLAEEVSDMSRLAARLVPQDQRGHRTPTDERTASGLVSGLTESVDSLMDEPVEAVRNVTHDENRDDAPNGESNGDDATGVVTPLLGTLVHDTASIAERPVGTVSDVYSTAASTTRLVTDGLRPLSDAPPGGALASGGGQPSLTALQDGIEPIEAAATLHRASDDRSVAALDSPPAGAQQRAPGDGAEQPWTHHSVHLQHLNTIPGGSTGMAAGCSVDSGVSAVDVSAITDRGQVSSACRSFGELGRPMDRAAELSVAPD